MKNKILSLAFILLALVFTIGLVSAALEMTAVSIPDTVNPNQVYTVTFTLRNTGDANQTGLSWVSSTVSPGTFVQLPTLDRINAGETRSLSATINVPADSTGTINLNLRVQSDASESATLTRAININNSAVITLTKKQELTPSQNGTFEIRNNGNTALNLVLSETTALGVTLSKTQVTLSPGQTDTITVFAPTNADLDFGNNAITIQARDNSLNAQNSITFTLKESFCNAGSKGGLRITNIDINNEGEGDENEWKLLDTIEIEVDVENTGTVDLNDIVVKLGLFDSEGSNQINDLDFEDADEEEFDLGDLDEDDEETATFRFRIPADIDSGSYDFAIKAFSDDAGENNECTDTSSDLSDDNFESISIENEDDESKFIAFEDVIVSPTEATCGDRVSVSAEVFNIGDEDQDQVKLTLINREMALDQFVEIRNDLDQGDSQEVTFEFIVPQGVTTKSYELSLGAQYDYRNGNYREALDENVRVPITILGCTGNGGGSGSTANTAITAQLTSDAVAGEELVVRSTITNLQSQRATVVIGADNYQDWASLTDVSSRILELDAGESEEVVFTFNVNDDVDGEQSFTIETVSANKTDRKEVAVELAESNVKGPGFSFGGENTYLWIIGLVNVILIILIIIVAIKVSRR